MPYHLEKVGRKYQVITTATGVPHSKAPMSKKKAEEQLRILNAHTDVVEHVGGFFSSDNTPAQHAIDAAKLALGMIPGIGNVVLVADMLGFITSQKPQKKEPTEAELIEAALAIQKTRDDVAAYNERTRIGKEMAAVGLNPDGSTPYKARLELGKITDKQLKDLALGQAKNAERQSKGEQALALQRKQLKEQLDAERIAQQRQALEEQQQQHRSGLNERSRALQAQITNAREAAQKSKILQQQRYQDQKLFLTKVNDIKRQDFFSQDRALREARQATIEAEQRRQAIKAAAASAAIPRPAPAPGAPQMIPTLGRRLPPSVLWHQ